MGRALGLAMIICVASCYQSPSLASCKYRCGGANNDSCPSGYSCNAGMCVAPGEGCDGDGGVIDAPPDDDARDGDVVDAPIDALVCATPGAFGLVKQTSLTTMNQLRQIVVLDANNDMKMDIVVLDEADRVGFFLGNGDGTFGARQASLAGANAKRIIVGDFDRDGKRDDLVVLQVIPTPAMSTLESNGDGTFARTTITLAPDAPIDIANAGDVDGNTFEDVVILYTTNSPRLAVMSQIDSGTFWQAGTTVGTDSTSTSLRMGRVDADAIADAVLTVPTTQFAFHAGEVANGTYSLEARTYHNVTSIPVQSTIGQLRSTGLPSVVTANASLNQVSIRHSLSAGGFSDGGSITVGQTPLAVILADIGGSALPDIVTADSASNTVTVLINNNNGVFDQAAMTLVDTNPIDVVSADFDGDQRADLALATPGQNSVTILLNKCPP